MFKYFKLTFNLKFVALNVFLTLCLITQKGHCSFFLPSKAYFKEKQFAKNSLQVAVFKISKKINWRNLD